MEYTKKVMEYFLKPRNMGELKNPDAIGEAGNPVCGDQLRIYLKIKNGKIQDIKFKALGCAAAISVSSVLTDMAKGKTINQASKISNKDIVKFLGGLPESKLHCSLLAEQALKDALKKYEAKNG